MAVHCFGISLTVSLAFYVGQMVTNSVLAYNLYFNDGIKTWFLPYIGLLLIPLVVVQLISAIMFLSKNGDRMSVTYSLVVAILHVFQFGYVWRHFTLLREVEPKSRSREFSDFNTLQLVHTFASMLPLLFIQTFLFYHHELTEAALLVTAGFTLFGTCLYLGMFVKSEHDAIESAGVSVARTSLRFVWRGGELLSRVISLTMFASAYYYWIFIIVGLHGLTMSVCLCTSIMGTFEKQGRSITNRVARNMVYSYMYMFCFIDVTAHSSAFRYVLYYVIMCLENVVLTLVWYMHSDQSHVYVKKDMAVVVSGGAFALAMVCLFIYYKWFRSKHAYDEEGVLITDEKHSCINCKLSVCSKHNIKLQRPFSAGWVTQYQKALATGNYYKNILHDTFLDSDSGESVRDLLNSSGEHCLIRDTDLESIRTNEKRYTSVQGTGTYTHKRFFDSDPNIKQHPDSDSISGGSGIYDDDWRYKNDAMLSQLTAQDTLSLLSSRTKLLTDSWDDLKLENVSLSRDPKHPKSMDILNSLIKKDLDSSFFSDGYDGYTTDYTLESYQLPVTVLAKRRARLFRRQPEPAYSVTSDSTDCTICSFIRNNPSSPESSRRKFPIHEDIPEETYAEVRKKRREDTGDRHLKYKKHRARSADSQTQRTGRYHREVINLNDIYSKPKRKAERTVKSVSTVDKSKPRNKLVSKIPVPTSTKIQSNQHRLPNVAIAAPVLPARNVQTKETLHENLPQCNIDLPQKNHKPRDLVFVSRVQETTPAYASDSGDSAFPRNTPLSSYLAGTDDDQDGISQSSCEMII